jgi:translation initiation factor 2 subunit 1
VTLDEYKGREGMVHLSEVASGWIKNIREHIREGQKGVCKVLSVDPSRGRVDLSIRRVKDSERRWKTERLKLEQRAERLLEMAAAKLGKNLDQAYEEAGFALQEKFEDLYAAFEAVVKDKNSIAEVVKDEKWVNALSEVSAATVQPPSFSVTGVVSLSCPAPNGVEVIKSAMVDARSSVKGDGVELQFYHVGAPKYRIEVTAGSYKVAEEALQRAAELAIAAVEKAGGKGGFQRAEQ